MRFARLSLGVAMVVGLLFVPSMLPTSVTTGSSVMHAASTSDAHYTMSNRALGRLGREYMRQARLQPVKVNRTSLWEKVTGTAHAQMLCSDMLQQIATVEAQMQYYFELEAAYDVGPYIYGYDLEQTFWSVFGFGSASSFQQGTEIDCLVPWF